MELIREATCSVFIAFLIALENQIVDILASTVKNISIIKARIIFGSNYTPDSSQEINLSLINVQNFSKFIITHSYISTRQR